MVLIVSTVCLVATPVVAAAAPVAAAQTTAVVGSASAAGGTAAAVAEAGALAAEVATATTVTGAPAGAAIAAAATNPVGWLVLGADESHDPEATGIIATYDCWKAVVHEDDATPSSGRLLREVLASPAIADFDEANMMLRNVWGEVFRLDHVRVAGVHALHAVRVA
jgi:hypothetical protein